MSYTSMVVRIGAVLWLFFTSTHIIHAVSGPVSDSMNTITALTNVDNYLSNIIDSIIQTGQASPTQSGQAQTTATASPSQAATRVNEHLEELLRNAISPTTLQNIGNIPRDKCLGFEPIGDGVITRMPSTPQAWSVWTYAPEAYARGVLCTWTCASGYVRSGNSCQGESAINTTSSGTTTPTDPQTRRTTIQNQVWLGPIAWKEAHKRVMLLGYAWTGDTEKFITPDMYVGTKLRPLPTKIDPKEKADIYHKCVHSNLGKSFHESLASSNISGAPIIKNIAKVCAQNAYGTYFHGKKYTTREEYLLLASTVFGSGYQIPGTFTSRTEYSHSGLISLSGYHNVSPRAWFSPLLKEGTELGMIQAGNQWSIAKEVTEQDIYSSLKYIAQKHNALSGSSATWEKDNKQYTIQFQTAPILHISIQ